MLNKALFPLALLLAGCSFGNAPQGMSNADIQTTMDKMSPEDRIKFIQNSPIEQSEKDKQIAEIKAKSGLK